MIRQVWFGEPETRTNQADQLDRYRAGLAFFLRLAASHESMLWDRQLLFNQQRTAK